MQVTTAFTLFLIVSLQQHIRKFIALSDEELNAVAGHFTGLAPKKKQLLQEADQLARCNYFVESGCLRMFFLDEKGTEKTVQFAIENWWLADYFSFQKQTRSGFYIQAVEASKVLAIGFEEQEQLLSDHPRLERYFRLVHQTAHAATQMRSMYDRDFSREEHFRYFVSLFPEFVQRVPQYMLASYLGITPEYLSELRAKMVP